MERPGIERLREHLRRHNRRVLMLTIAAFLIAAALWAALYLAAWWLFLLAGTAVLALDFHPRAAPVGRGFCAAAALLCLCAWMARRLHPNEAPRDRKSFFEHLLDMLLAIPRWTLLAFGTGAAAARLSDAELEYAWTLLRRMSKADHPILMQQLPAEIPDPAMRKRIVLALQLADLIEIRVASTGPVIAFRNEEARLLAQDRVRLRS